MIPQRLLVFTLFLLMILVVLWIAQQRLLPTDQVGSEGEATPSLLSPSDLSQGCPFQDCIPSIDDPKFLSARV